MASMKQNVIWTNLVEIGDYQLQIKQSIPDQQKAEMKKSIYTSKTRRPSQVPLLVPDKTELQRPNQAETNTMLPRVHLIVDHLQKSSPWWSYNDDQERSSTQNKQHQQNKQAKGTSLSLLIVEKVCGCSLGFQNSMLNIVHLLQNKPQSARRRDLPL